MPSTSPGAPWLLTAAPRRPRWSKRYARPRPPWPRKPLLDASGGIAARLDKHDAAQAWSPLTLREFEVARLVACRLTNREIAEELHITARTAGAHLEHIRAKLSAGRRSEIAAWVTSIDGSGQPG